MKNKASDFIKSFTWKRASVGNVLTMEECAQIADAVMKFPELAELVAAKTSIKRQMEDYHRFLQSTTLQSNDDPFNPSDSIELIDDTQPRIIETMPRNPFDNYAKKKPKRNLRLDTMEVDRTFTPSLLVESEFYTAMSPSDNEDFDTLRDSLNVLRGSESTLVFAVAIDGKNPDNNIMSAIRCYGGTAFGGYAHDVSRDSYLINCVEIMQLGQIPFSYVVTMTNVGDWQIKVPIPEATLEKHFNPQQRKILNEFRTRFPAPQYDINFIQMLGCN